MLYFLFFTAKIRKKKQIHFAVLCLTASLIIWNSSVLFYLTFTQIEWVKALCEKLYFLSIILVSIAILFTGLIFAQTKIKFTRKHALLFVVPIISVIILFSNQYHHLFYTTFSLIPSKQVFGFYFIIHTIYSYLCIGIGLAYLGFFSVKNFGIFSKQALLIFFAIFISLIVDSFSTFNIFDWSAAIENIVFAVCIICFILAIIKFDFLNVIPIALQTVVDLISDGYIVINEDYEIVDYNKTFLECCPGVTRKGDMIEFIEKNCSDFDRQQFVHFLEESVHEQKKITFEMQKPVGETITYYMTEITPILRNDNHIGTIILIKNITEHKNNLAQVIQLNERLQSLATRDWLTQAYNRYFFDERLQQEIDRVNKKQTYGSDSCKAADNFGLIMFDIDYFKTYNDRNGHPAGDNLLQEVVNLVKEVLFPTDILCRYGGEEFAVICCQTSAEGVRIAAEKIRQAVENYEFKYQDKQPNGNLTVSVGTAYCSTAYTRKDDLIKIADENLYLAKNSGKNKVVFHQVH
ncbi:MAG: diguanylate cyclase [Peptococcaceae bacterium]|nr:diguanylate cyclase [Peptococcaceae bacterium]